MPEPSGMAAVDTVRARSADGDFYRSEGAKLMSKVVIAGLLLISATSVANAQDLAAGEQSFKKCLPCHAVGEGAKNKVGPVLNGLEGRKSGTIEGFTYSDANKNSGITWNKEVFLEYIKDPRA